MNQNKRNGKPWVCSLYSTVYEVPEYLASEITEAKILEDCPNLTQEHFKTCIAYTANHE